MKPTMKARCLTSVMYVILFTATAIEGAAVYAQESAKVNDIECKKLRQLIYKEMTTMGSFSISELIENVHQKSGISKSTPMIVNVHKGVTPCLPCKGKEKEISIPINTENHQISSPKYGCDRL